MDSLDTKTIIKSKEEANLYFKLLGAKDTGTGYYLLDNLFIKYDNNCNNISIKTDNFTSIQKEIIKKLDDYGFFIDNSLPIQDLESLIFIYGLLTGIRTDINSYTKEKTKEIRLLALKYELKNNLKYFKDCNLTNIDSSTLELKKHLNIFLKMLYPLSINGIDEELETFVDKNIFHPSGIRNGIHFEWDFKSIKFEYQSNEKDTFASIKCDYGDASGIESFSYIIKGDEEILYYSPSPGWGGSDIEINLTKQIIKTYCYRLLKTNDLSITEMDNYICAYLNLLKEPLSYLNKGLVPIEKEENNKKGLLKRLFKIKRN